MTASFRALRLTKTDAAPKAEIVDLADSELMEGDVTVRIDYSTVNYKDGLAITGAAPVVRVWPMIPGIDFSGVVEVSANPNFKPGDRVVQNCYGLGETCLGGYAQKARVKGEPRVQRSHAISNA